MNLKPSQKFFELVRRYQSFLITAHVTPDPDAICSELVMARFLTALGKKVSIVNHDGVPDRLRFLPGSGKIQKYDEKHRYDFEVALVLDSGDLNRVGKVRQLLTQEKIVVNIDHHITSHPFGDVNIVMVDASSTAEVLFDLFHCQKKFVVDEMMAALLYVGIMTDTGSFRYENTSAHTHAVTAELLKVGVRPASFYRQVYETIPLSDFRYFTHVVCRFEVYEKGRVIGLKLRKSTVRRFSEEFDLRDKLFRELRGIKGVQVVFIVTEDGKNLSKVNLRSHGPVDVARIAAHFGGGGHRKASGCHMHLSLPKAQATILTQIKKVL